MILRIPVVPVSSKQLFSIIATTILCSILLLPSCSVVEAAAANEISMGTTIVALRSKQGVVVGADTRTSMSTMVSNRFANKLSLLYQSHDPNGGGPISCYLCRSGSAADTQYLADECRWKFRSRALKYGAPPSFMGASSTITATSNNAVVSISQIARWLRYVVMNGNGQYSASLLVAGYDPLEGGKIYSIAQTGSLLEEPVYAAAGSGSTFILGLMDMTLQEHYQQQCRTSNNNNNDNNFLLEEPEAIELVAKLIHAAIARDGASGGVARLVVMNDQGSREMIVHPPPNTQQGATSKEDGSPKELKGFMAAKPPPKLVSLPTTSFGIRE